MPNRCEAELSFPTRPRKKPQQGKIIAAGKGKRLEDGTVAPLDVKTGDRILFAKYSGSEVQIEGSEYLILREDEVLGVVEENTAESQKAA